MSPEPHPLPESIGEEVDIEDGEAEFAIAVTDGHADFIGIAEE